jgi:hypothetical protein
MVYIWHENQTGAAFNHALSIYNPNSFPIKVTSTNYGLTNASSIPDSSAWASYFNTTNLSVTINANSYGTLFSRSIPNGNNFGIVAKTNVTNSSTGSAAQAVFYDIAWTSNSSGATACAAPYGTEFRRGVGNSYYNEINFDTIAPTDSTNGIAYRIAGSSDDVFGTSDLVYITDESGQRSGYLIGSYAQQLSMTFKVKNNFTTTKNFRIFMGTNVGNAYFFPLVNMAGVTQKYDWCDGGMYQDMIDTGSISPGQTVTVSFFTVVPAISSTPFVIGARPI